MKNILKRNILFLLPFVLFISCGNISDKVEEKINELNSKTDELDSLVNKEFDKVIALDSIINKEGEKVKKLDSLINKSTSKIDSIAKEKMNSLRKISN